MRLQNIEMQGFKSFADKIYLDFNSGITAIVGPNGSGKSNISDAIRWVMGEQSIKSLRGSRMEDVIFSGTEQRKALGFAEVTLTLDNTDNYFPLDFPQISVTRRVYRSGDSEYYINKTLCRLKDVHELFMDTGLGRDGYSIIGQGKIDSILSTKSDDRRQIFEEAAGISKYKYRKIEAERKLAQTVDNLTRVKDILSELEVQLGPLEKQSEKARKFLLLRDQLKGIDITVSVIDIDKIKDEINKINEDLSVLNHQIEDISSVLDIADKDISDMYTLISDIDAKIEELSTKERELGFKINEAEKKCGILQNDFDHNVSSIERLNSEITDISASLKITEDEIKTHKDELLSLNKKNIENKTELDRYNTLMQASSSSAAEKGSVLENLKSRLMDISARKSNVKIYIDNTNILKESFVNRKTSILNEIKDKENNVISLKQNLDEATKNLNFLNDERNKLSKTINDINEKRKKYEEDIKDLSAKKNDLLLEISRNRSRKSMLADMEKEMEGYAKGVKSVMSAYKSGIFKNAKIYGPLATLIKTDEKYITAIETSLGAANQNIVVESEDEAKQGISYLKTKHLGRATFLPVSAIKEKSFDFSAASKCQGYISTADKLVACDNKFKKIVSSYLSTTVICDNIDNAVDMAKKNNHKFRIVTLQGDIIQAGGAMTGGSVGKTVSSLSRNNEIDTLAKKISELEDLIKKQDTDLNDLNLKLEGLNKETEVINLKENEINAKYLNALGEKEKYAAMWENSNSSDAKLKAELSEIENRLSDMAKDIEIKNKELDKIQKEREEFEKTTEVAQAEFSRMLEENDKLTEKITNLNIARSSILKDIEYQNERIEVLNLSLAELIENQKIKLGGIETLKERNTDIKNEISVTMDNICDYNDKKRSCSKETTELSLNRKKNEDDIRRKQKEMSETREQKFALSSKASKIENRLSKLSSDKDAIIDRLWDDYEITYSDASLLKQDKDFDYNIASDKIKELKSEIKKLGNINIDAIEEYKNVKERFDFLSAQTLDLEKSKGELDSVISEMMEIMQTNFAEKFKTINIGFNKVFSELFGGGSANLYLTDPDNVLESGIEIEAQPPGKKLQSLTLLSGGERAFTAIALLFAILDVRPTPFCILDEIEAALDDANVYRYADYLKKYSKKTQFIVVTHRRGTMEAANVLYGVTMQEKGISKLLSLNIDEVGK